MFEIRNALEKNQRYKICVCVLDDVSFFQINRLLLISAFLIPATVSNRCIYGVRGSLTATCVNVTATYFKSPSYRFDNLDETLICVNCTLDVIDGNTFDIAGNLIKNLDLSNSKITLLKESSFVGLVFLENLILRNNQISIISPLTFHGIKKLITLDLQNNTITSIKNDSFKELINLQTLNLRDNAIQLMDTFAFNGLIKLRKLNLNNNQIKGVKDLFAPLKSIETIDLEQNRIADIYFNDINATTLTYLNLARNYIRLIRDNSFLNINNLYFLDLSWNRIMTLSQGSFNRLTNLTVLQINSNFIETISLGVLSGLHNLRSLQLAGNKIRELRTGIFSGLPELGSLNMSNNKIQSIAKTGVLPLHSLHTLDLSSNLLIDVDYELLIRNMPRLASLSVQGNRLPCYIIRDMRKFFGNDSFDIHYDNYDEKACKLINPSLAKNVTVTTTNSMSQEWVFGKIQSSHNTAMYSLFTILFLLICLLYFMQFKLFQMWNYGGGLEKHSSRAQLVSEDLENGDYLKE